MEVRPQFELKDYTGVEVERKKVSITEEEVQNRLEQIRKANGKLEPLDEERPIGKEDYAVLTYESFENGLPLEVKAENFLLRVGSQDFHPQFEEALIGLKKGDRKEIEIDFEESFYHKKLAGRRVVFKVEVVDIKRMVLPELNDDFAKNLGADLKDVEDLRNKVRENMIAQEEKRSDRDLKQRLLEKISEGVDFEIPEILLESEMDYAVENVRQNLIRSGSSLEKAGLSEEKLKEEFRPASRKRVKEMLILGEIARQKELSVTEEELTEGYGELARESGQDPDIIKQYYEVRNMVDSLKERLLEQKTLNYLVEHAKVTEVEKEALGGTDGSEKEKE